MGGVFFCYYSLSTVAVTIMGFYVRSLFYFAALCVFLWLLLQSFGGGRERLLLYFYCILDVMSLLLFFTSFSMCRELVVRDCGISGNTHIFSKIEATTSNSNVKFNYI